MNVTGTPRLSQGRVNGRVDAIGIEARESEMNHDVRKWGAIKSQLP